MARARNIKPGFFKNEDLAELPFEVRLLFIGLWTLADREGRLEDRPRRIKGELFAYESFDIDPMLNQLQASKFIVRYEFDGSRFIQIENFVKHQDPHYKEKASEIPPPEGSEDIIKATAITKGQRARILERDGHKCQSCGAAEHLCIDHIIPASRGGCSSDDNLQVLCYSCNATKGNKLDGELVGIKKGRHDQTSLLIRANVGANLIVRNDASPSDSLIPDSLIPDSLIPDTGFREAHAVPDPAPELPAMDRSAPDGAARAGPTMAATVCKAIKAEGIASVNPSHPLLATLIAAGADGPLFEAAARSAKRQGKGFAWVLGAVQGQMRDAAQAAADGLMLPPSRDSPPEPAWRAEQRQRTAQAVPGIAAKPGADWPKKLIESEVFNGPAIAMG